MLYHAGVSWLPAGFLGVDLFFVLSGFLITTLLIQEFRHRTTIKLGEFWARRARRLLPALFLVVIFCSLVVWVVTRAGTYPSFESDSFSALFYVSNWHFIADGNNYFLANSAPSLLTHTWSLAIEEQFYILWPVVLLVLWKCGRGLRTTIALTAGGALASTAWMAYLYHHGASLDRLYYGTDTHSQCLMVGATVAVGLVLIRHRSQVAISDSSADVSTQEPSPGVLASQQARQRAFVAGSAGLVVLVACWFFASWSGSFLYNGGFLVVALSAALVIVSLMLHPVSPLAKVLSTPSLVFIGRISYGLYLWHFPIFQVLSFDRMGFGGIELLLLRFSVTFLAAIASFYLLERPIRHTRSLPGWKTPAVMALGLCIVVATVVGATHASASSSADTSQIQQENGAVVPSTHQPIRIMFVGDSVSFTLGGALLDPLYLSKYNATVLDAAVFACGVMPYMLAKRFVSVDHVPWCTNEQVQAPSQTVYGRYAHYMKTFRPNIVVVLSGRWETVDEVVNGTNENIRQPKFQQQVRAGLKRLITMSKTHGARAVLYSFPCIWGGSAVPIGNETASEINKRITIYNGLVASVAKQNSSDASYFNFDKLACPGGQFRWSLDGTVIRNPDGDHINVGASKVLSPRLLPYLVKQGTLARNHTNKTG